MNCSFHCHPLVIALTRIVDVVENLKAKLILFLFACVELILKREEQSPKAFILGFLQRLNVYVAYLPDLSRPCSVLRKREV